MVKWLCTIVLLGFSKSMTAQHIQYREKPKPPVLQPASVAPPIPKDTAIVYHKWPDKCPGINGKIPVISSYVPKDLILKLTEIYKGYLYSITPVKISVDKYEYRLKVCDNGEIRDALANDEGKIIRKE